MGEEDVLTFTLSPILPFTQSLFLPRSMKDHRTKDILRLRIDSPA